MPNFNLPHTFHDAVDEVASGSQVDEDLTTLKERIETLENAAAKLNGVALTAPFEFKTFTSAPTCGPGSGQFTYSETGINFPVACQAAWLGGWVIYTSNAHTPTDSTATTFNAGVKPNGKSVDVTFQNQSGITLYPFIYIVALGH